MTNLPPPPPPPSNPAPFGSQQPDPSGNWNTGQAPGFGAPPPGYVAYGQGATQAVPYASGGQRVGARIIDIILWIIVSAVVNAIFGVSAVATNNVSFGAIVLASFISGAIIVSYEVFMTTSAGGTLGKKALKISIIDEHGAAPTTQQMLMRMSTYLGAIVLGVIPVIGIVAAVVNFLIGIVSLVLVFSDDRHQAVWDKIAKTVVRTN